MRKNEIILERKQFNKLINKLDTLIKITAASIFRGEKIKEGIIFLTDLGFTANEVTKILETTEQYVYNVNSETKKQKKKKLETIEKEKTPAQGTQTSVQ
jgi:hypothetical protein